MNYIVLIQRITLLISSPARAWEEIGFEEDRQKVFTAFVYPLIGLCGLAVFLGTLWTEGISYQVAMTRCCVVFASLFGGCFLAAYAVNILGEKKFQQENDLPLIRQFVGYSLVVLFLLDIVTGLFPDFKVLAWMFQFYTVYIVWEATRSYIPVAEKDRLNYTLIASALILFAPALITFIFNSLLVINI